MFAGEMIRKSQIPKYYVREIGVNNLNRLKLNGKRSAAAPSLQPRRTKSHSPRGLSRP